MSRTDYIAALARGIDTATRNRDTARECGLTRNAAAWQRQLDQCIAALKRESIGDA